MFQTGSNKNRERGSVLGKQGRFSEDLWLTVSTPSFGGNTVILQLLQQILHYGPAPETTSDPESASFTCLRILYLKSSVRTVVCFLRVMLFIL